METLPQEAIYAFLDTAGDFGVIVNLYEVNRQARAILDCQVVLAEPRVYTLINEARICVTSDIQTKLLERLNVKFKFKVRAPITWLKLRRAYNRSALNPRCREYNSLYACLKSAAKYDLVAQFTLIYAHNSYPIELRKREYAANLAVHNWLGHKATLLDDYLNQKDVVTRRDKRAGKDVDDASEWYFTTMLSFIRIAYKNQSFGVGEMLYAQLLRYNGQNVRTYKAEMWRVSAWVRYYLTPYKIRTNREIRRQHSAVLYDPQVSDLEKRDIWASQYANLDKLQFPEGTDPMIIEETQRIIDGESTFIAELVKRGYFSSVQHLGFRNIGLDTTISESGRSEPLLWFLRKFEPEHIEQIAIGLSKFYARPPPTPLDMLRLAADKGSYRLYTYLIAKYDLPSEEYATLGPFMRPSLDGVFVLNDLLAKYVELFPGGSMTFRSIITNLYPIIWRVFGRRQFEDSLLYIIEKFRVDMRPALVIMLWEILTTDMGLFAYAFGYELTLSKEKRRFYTFTKLEPPGIFNLKSRDLGYCIRECQESTGAGKYEPELSIILEELKAQLGKDGR